MKIFSLVFTLLVCSSAFAEVPNSSKQVNSGVKQTQKQSNQSGWQYAKWGMTADQIVQASKGKARAVYGEEQRKKSNPYYFDCLAVSDFKTGPFEFEVNFRAKLNEKTLDSVYLNLRNPDQYEELKDSLRSKYGEGVTTVKGKQIITTWKTKSEVIKLQDFQEVLRFVSLEYTKRVYGPRGLDL